MARYYVANDNQFRKAAKVLLNAWAKIRLPTWLTNI